jgi:peptidyl-prolyl cis-trans isomerase C
MKLLREPLFHFVALGAVLALTYGVATDKFSSGASRRIEITQSEIQFLASSWERQWRRPPTEEELLGLVEARVREEVLYREALAVGLDQNDVVVRRRMVQKMELLSQDLALLADPTDEELRSFFQEHREDYRVPPRISFSHVFFNADRRGPAVEEDARRVLAQIRAETPPPRRAPERGDRFMLQHDYSLRSPQQVQQLFGSRFAEALFELEPGWHGPVPSGYGIHLVNVGERVASRIPDYGEIRDRLVVDYNRMRRDRANEALYESLVSGYEVVIDEEAVRRTALVTLP